MKTEQWGYTNPVVSALYSKPPLIWRDTQVVLVEYETTLDRIRSVLPEPLEPWGNHVIAWVSYTPLGTQGACHEACLYVQAKFKDYVGTYEPYLYVTTEIPLAAGREIWGFCKKLANINLRLDKEIARGEVERVGTQIMTIQTTIDTPASYDELPWGDDGVFSLKNIPAAEEGEPALRQLVLTAGKVNAVGGRFFKGRGSISFEHSDIDPLDILKPERVIAGYYGIIEMYLPLGKIVHRYPEFEPMLAGQGEGG
jgi:acetoacetate decarboxylase